VALFIRGGSYAYQDEVVIGAHQECGVHGVDLYCLSGGNVVLQDPHNFVYALPDPRQFDAAIVVKGTMGAEEGDATVAGLVDRLRPLPTCMIGAPEPGVPSVLIDNSSGVRALTRHLIEKHDCRRIAFVTGHGREAEQRLAGYHAGHRDRGLTADGQLTIKGDFRFSAGQEAVAQLFDAGRGGCDALVAANDWMALGALEALRARGLRVPEDVAVVGFDDVDEARSGRRRAGWASRRCVWCWPWRAASSAATSCWTRCRRSGSRAAASVAPGAASPSRPCRRRRTRARPTTPPGSGSSRRAVRRLTRRCPETGPTGW
jgi:DNA-binding LacI/PurR family transcriptional regulator